jgi:MFS family permease
MSVGAGVSIGPVLGGMFYSYLNYESSFFIIAGIYAIFSWIFIALMKHDVEKDQLDLSPTSPSSPSSPLSSYDMSKSNSALEMDHIVEHLEMKYSVIFRNRNFFMTFFVYCISYSSITLIQPTFLDHIHSFGYDSDTVGLLFALADLAYALTSIGLIKVFKYFKRKHLFIFGGALTALSLLLLGPEDFTYLPKDITVISVGMVFFGLSQVFYNATIIPEFIELLNDIYGNRRGINEMGSGIYNSGLALSEFIGPLLGGILADLFGFSRGLTIYAIFLGFYLIIYGLFIRRPIKDTREKLIENNFEL